MRPARHNAFVPARSAILHTAGAAVLALLAGVWLTAVAAAQEPLAEPALPVVTNVLQFHRLARHTQRATCALHLEGIVRWASPAGNLLALQDDSGVALIETGPQNPPLQPGQTIVVEGNCSGSETGASLRIGRRLLVDNDGLHGMEEESGVVFLKQGKQPIYVAWFDGNRPYGLEVYYEGPNLPRQRISDSALWRPVVAPAREATNWVAGVNYRAYEAQWSGLPDFHQPSAAKPGSYEGQWSGLPAFHRLKPSRVGTAPNFDVTVRTRDTHVGLEFSGYVEVPADGLYTFSTVSAGGSQLFLELPRVRVVGAGALPPPRPFTLGQVLPQTEECAWAEVEGDVTFISNEGNGGLRLELSSGTGRAWGEIADVSGGLPVLVLGSRLRVTGICRCAYTLDEQVIPGMFWTPSLAQVKPVQSVPKLPSPDHEAGPFPTLTTVEQIKRLKREEATRGYPVRIRGVITWSARTALVIQDTTQGIYVDEVAARDSYPLRVGEYWEIEGVTSARFSPVVIARQATRLGAGTLPEPVHPARDQLLNGSLDAQYVEVQGIVTTVQARKLTLLTREGKIQVHLIDLQPADLKAYAGALVRIRGCLCAVKDNQTLEFKVGEVEIRCASINVDQAPATDPFATPAKHASDLLLFDAQASAFQQVKVAGQIVHTGADELDLMDGGKGLRFIPQTPVPLQVGDHVEVVGFPELGGPSPVLREAVVRRTGKGPLPQPKPLPTESLLQGELDATLVTVTAQLVSLSTDRKEQVLGLQTGPHIFAARLASHGGPAYSVPVGSRLELTGIYVGRGGDRSAGRDIDSFELLLNSPADIRVLARPSWWTFNRLLAIVGVLAGVMVAALVWIGLLRQQVEQRTVQLRTEIHERERAEHQRVVEAERARIARDLHDDLGSSLTEISLLSDAGPGSPPNLEKAGSRFRLIGEKARSLVNTLDVIVWLVNPRKDALPFLAGYLASFAEEFLAASAVACKLKIPVDIPQLRLTAEVRHSLFLAVKETLNNVVRHAHASEAGMELTVHNGRLDITITDNGCGFDPASPGQGNGLTNIHERMARVGGQCRITSQPQIGTIVSLTLPLPTSSNSK